MIRAKNKYRFDPDYAVPPGETLAETIDALGMSQRDLAERTGLTEQSINRIIKGTQPISRETAEKLELVTSVPAAMWNSLEASYRERCAKLEERRQSAPDLEWLKAIPVSDLVRLGAIPAERDRTTRVRDVLAFYRVSSIDAWRAHWERREVAARRSVSTASALGPTSAWIRLGEREAEGIACEPYDKERFLTALRRIRALTVKDPVEFVPKMRQRCAEAGVALCLVPEIRGAPWHGAAMWLSATKGMILLSLRGKRDDQFWFSFFHEAGHLLHDGKKQTFLDQGYTEDPQERQANKFAREFLIPPESESAVAAIYSKADVAALAKKLGISPGIVVGRHQHMTKKWTYFNGLKVKLEWSDLKASTPP